MLAMNQLVNVAAKSRYMYGGQVHVPLVVRAMIGKSWGQGAQHSQGLHSFFMHVPGLKVVAPSTPYDAKGCLLAAIRDDNPVLYVEHRMLHFQNGPVPESRYTVAAGQGPDHSGGRGRHAGRHLATCRSECLRAQRVPRERRHAGRGDRPDLAQPARYRHHRRTRCERPAGCSSWITAGPPAGPAPRSWPRSPSGFRASATSGFRRLGFAPVTCPTTPTLEELFYPNARTIAAAARDLVEGPSGWLPEERADLQASSSRGRSDMSDSSVARGGSSTGR